MAVLTTTTCRRYRHPEFRLRYDPEILAVEDDVKWFFSWLEESVSQGKRYVAGETCQVGWGMVEFRKDKYGDLTIWEPDMRQIPIAWSESVSRTLAHLRLQKDVVESVLSLEKACFPSMRDSAIICSRLGRCEGLVMERGKPEGNNSGWYFGCNDENHDHDDIAELRCVSLYEAAVNYSPRIVPFLALPEGILVVSSRSGWSIFQDGDRLDLTPGSYLATCNERQ